MKYLIRFNESMEEKIYNQVLDSIKDCFQEFEDNGWQWSQGSSVDDRLSYYPIPHFKYIMKEREDGYVPFHKWGKNGRFEFTGSIDSDGEISWETKTTTHTNNLHSEDFLDFLVAIKRLQQEIGLDFKFSYNNLGGDRRIIIQGKI